MKQEVFVATCLALSLAAMHVRAQSEDNSKAGFALAQQVCSVCHAVERGQTNSPNPKAPMFTQLASAPGMTSAALLVALTTPHAGMPMLTLSAQEREGIIAYILSLH